MAFDYLRRRMLQDIGTDYGSAFHDERLRFQILKEMESLPATSTFAYFQALKICPKLIARESDPVRFYGRRSTLTPAVASTAIRDAADLLARNWLIRVNLFRERAFLPMLCASEHGGALFPHDNELLENGSFSMLPAEKNGRPVLLYHIPKEQTNLTAEMKLSQPRCSFHLLTTIAQEAKAFTWIRFGESMYVNTLTPNAIGHFAEAMPLELGAFHSILVHPPGARRMVEKTVLPNLNLLFGKYITDRQVTHLADSREKAVASLEKNGISKTIIPSRLSGSWDLRCFFNWLKFRANVDRSLRQKYITSSFFDVESQTGNAAYAACKVSVFDLGAEGKEHSTSRNSARSKGFKSTVSKLLQTSLMSNAFVNERLRYKILKEMESLPVESIMAYCEASERCPELIARESDPVSFLRNNETNPKNAAMRLAKYWEHRLQLFQHQEVGEERAFLPFTCTGSEKGALRVAEAQILSSGCCALLPPDEKGRPVLFIRLPREDEGRRRKEEGRDIYFRILLYLISCLAQKKEETNSVVILAVRDSAQAPVFLQSVAGGGKKDLYKDDALTVFLQATPVDICSVHNIYFAPQREKAKQLIMGATEVRYLTERRQHVHICSHAIEVRKELAKFGLNKDSLPASLGGNWSFESFYKWIVCRRQVESNLEKKLITDLLQVSTNEVVNGQLEHNKDAVQLKQKGKISSLLETLPIDLSVLHCCFMVPACGRAETKVRLTEEPRPSVSQTIGDYAANRLINHIADGKEGLSKSLNAKFEFVASSLPEVVGGTWTYKSHEDWLDERCRADRDPFRVALPTSATQQEERELIPEAHRDLNKKTSFCRTQELKHSNSSSSSSSRESLLFTLTEKSKLMASKYGATRKLKEAVAGYLLEESSNKRMGRGVPPAAHASEKAKSFVMGANHDSQNNYSELTGADENAGSKAEGKSTTEENVAHMDERARLAERRKRKRQMDVLYARERRKREKTEEGTLTKQAEYLKSQNDLLRSEVVRLERLMELAKTTVDSHIPTILATQNVKPNLGASVTRHLPVAEKNTMIPPPLNPSMALQLQHRPQNKYLGTPNPQPTTQLPFPAQSPHRQDLRILNTSQSDNSNPSTRFQVARSMAVAGLQAKVGVVDIFSALRSGINDRGSELLGEQINPGSKNDTTVANDGKCLVPVNVSEQGQKSPPSFEAKASKEVANIESQSPKETPTSVVMASTQDIGHSNLTKRKKTMPRGSIAPETLNPGNNAFPSGGLRTVARENNSVTYFVQQNNMKIPINHYPRQQPPTGSSLDWLRNNGHQLSGFCGALMQQLNSQSSAVQGPDYPQTCIEPEIPSFQETFLLARQLQAIMVNKQRKKIHMSRQSHNLQEDVVRNMLGIGGQHFSGMHASPPRGIGVTHGSTFQAPQSHINDDLRRYLARQLNMSEDVINSLTQDQLINLYNSLQRK